MCGHKWSFLFCVSSMMIDSLLWNDAICIFVFNFLFYRMAKCCLCVLHLGVDVVDV